MSDISMSKEKKYTDTPSSSFLNYHMVMILKQSSESCEKIAIKKEQSNMVKHNELDKLG